MSAIDEKAIMVPTMTLQLSEMEIAALTQLCAFAKATSSNLLEMMEGASQKDIVAMRDYGVVAAHFIMKLKEAMANYRPPNAIVN